LHVLVNNAGALFGDRQVTSEGLERTFALNHMAYFALTPRCWTCSAPARRPASSPFSSEAARGGRIELSDLQMERLIWASASTATPS